MWTAPTPDLVDGPVTGADRPILEGFLTWQRTTLLNICAGLSGEQLAARPLASSNLSLLGLIRHLAKVERIWFRQRAAGEPVEPMYDPSGGKDSDFDDIDPTEAEVDSSDCTTNGAARTRRSPAWRLTTPSTSVARSSRYA